MESRLKERLTGAAILVALIVLVVPEIFHDRRSAPAATGPGTPSAPAARSAGSAAPTRSYTIDLSPVVPAVPARQAAVTPAASPQVPSGPVAASSKAAQPSSAASASQGSAHGAVHHTAAPAKLSPPAAPLEAPPSARTETHGAGGWMVQLGLFAKEANAQRLVRSAQSHGIAVAVTRYGTRGLYRVAVTDVANRAAAEQISHRLHAAGLPAAILGPR